ncbi:MAG TPA: DUF4337 domain-containing protein [Planctomycetota bacterium]|nr:DUF4337 domain-containing protein [Planctomycetota bacterium]
MSEHEVPLEELHEHIHEHAHEAKEKWIGGVALSTALLATAAAIAALLSSRYEGMSARELAKAHDKWGYFQAERIKENVLQSKIDTFAALGKPLDASEKIADYQKKQKALKAEAQEFENISEEHEVCQSRFALGVTMFQIAIAIGAISVLTKKKPFWFVSLIFGLAGLGFLGYGAISIPKVPEHAEHGKEAPEKAKEGAGKEAGEKKE